MYQQKRRPTLGFGYRVLIFIWFSSRSRINGSTLGGTKTVFEASLKLDSLELLVV
jgi:hypothetical protein